MCVCVYIFKKEDLPKAKFNTIYFFPLFLNDDTKAFALDDS